MSLSVWVTLAAALGPAPQEPVSFQLLDNPGFDEPLPAFRDDRGVRRVPWWRTARGSEQIVIVDGEPALRTAPGEWAEQPVAAYAPLIEGLVVRGTVRGRGRLVVLDGAEGRAAIELGTPGGTRFESFELDHAAFAGVLGRPLVPRLVVRLEPAGTEVAVWRDIEALVPLPLPSEAELRAAILAELSWIFALWLERGRDDVGRETGFIGHLWDVLSGERLLDINGGHHVVFDLLGQALEVENVPAWREAYERFVADYLELCVHPTTGLPRTWDCIADVPNDAGFMELAPALGFLVDLAETGEGEVRARARAAVERAGETILDRAVLPDGEIAAKLRSGDGAPNTGYAHLRRLNLPAQLERIGRLTGDERYFAAVREAVASFEYSHGWPGTWDEIDPGFDDNYGNFGAMAVRMWRASPDEKMFRRLALSGLETYLPIWDDALRFGGNVAADQVRCWKVLADVTELEPTHLPRVARLVRRAARTHFKGGQYGDGAWGDVTIGGFDPKGDLQVGDIKGTPQNLLNGLAIAYDRRLTGEPEGPSPEELRAMFSAVLGSSRTAYRREFGYMTGRREVPGADNWCGGSARLAVGLVAMLRRLTPPR